MSLADDIKQLSKTFFKFDKSGDGVLSRRELYSLLKAGNPSISQQESRLLFDRMDIKKDGCIEFDEFVEYLFEEGLAGTSEDRQSGKAALEEAFAQVPSGSFPSTPATGDALERRHSLLRRVVDKATAEKTAAEKAKAERATLRQLCAEKPALERELSAQSDVTRIVEDKPLVGSALVVPPQNRCGRQPVDQRVARTVRNKFATFDTNSDGKLSRREFGEFLKSHNQKMTSKEMKLLFDKIDRNTDGYIDFDEFLHYVFGPGREIPAKLKREVGEHILEIQNRARQNSTRRPSWTQSMESLHRPSSRRPSKCMEITLKPVVSASAAVAQEDFEDVDICLARYTEPQYIWDALELGHVRLVRMSWLIQQNDRRRPLLRRQTLPPQAFISVEELKEIYGEGNRDKVLPIIAISYCWLTKAHPDPEGRQLEIVARCLEREEHKYQKLFREMGIFWDWLSLHQKNHRGERSKTEQVSFDYALKKTMDLWYAHQGTTVFLLTKFPEGGETTRKDAYGDSGWPTYERCSAEQIKKFNLLDVKWKLVLDLGADEDAATMRNWPTGPDDFDKLIDGKIFTNGADRGAVKELFRRMSHGQLGGIKELDLTHMRQPDVEEARRFGRCLSLCVNLNTLDLQHVRMSNFQEICSSLRRDALRSCQKVNFHDAGIDDVGVGALSEAFSRGALAGCQELILSYNRIGDQGVRSLSNALAPPHAHSEGALRRCETLSLNNTAFGISGARSIAKALGRGALPSCRVLNIGNTSDASVLHITEAQSRNFIGDEGAQDLSEALRAGGLANCEEIHLNNTCIGDSGACELAQALKYGALHKCVVLNLGHNRIGDTGVQALLHTFDNGALKRCNKLIISTEDIKACVPDVLHALRTRPIHCPVLDLSNINLGSHEQNWVMSLFLEAINRGALQRCRVLKLVNNFIDSEVPFCWFSDALWGTSLGNCQELILSCNRIGTRGMSHLLKACERGALRSLKALILSCNSISDADVSPLFDGLRAGAMKGCELIDLRCNNISTAGADDLWCMLCLEGVYGTYPTILLDTARIEEAGADASFSSLTATAQMRTFQSRFVFVQIPPREQRCPMGKHCCLQSGKLNSKLG